MSGFALLFGQWELAEIAAVRAERGLSRQLDAYCEGWGRAPSLHEITAARHLRARAGELLRSLQAQLARDRHGAAVL